MGIKKILKKENPNRHKVFLSLREGGSLRTEEVKSSTKSKIYPDKSPRDMTKEEWAEWKIKKNVRQPVDKNNLYTKNVKIPNGLTEFNNSFGNTIFLNVPKRIMLNKPYVSDEFKREVVRFVNKAMKAEAAARQPTKQEIDEMKKATTE
jgi:hypothetical protein